jgi:hypothetical protein
MQLRTFPRGGAWALGALLLVQACKSTSTEGELTRAECVDLVRHKSRLEAGETSGLGRAMDPTERARVERCMEAGTKSAHRCVMAANSREDLAPCELLFE